MTSAQFEIPITKFSKSKRLASSFNPPFLLYSHLSFDYQAEGYAWLRTPRPESLKLYFARLAIQFLERACKEDFNPDDNEELVEALEGYWFWFDYLREECDLHSYKAGYTLKRLPATSAFADHSQSPKVPDKATQACPYLDPYSPLVAATESQFPSDPTSLFLSETVLIDSSPVDTPFPKISEDTPVVFDPETNLATS